METINKQTLSVCFVSKLPIVSQFLGADYGKESVRGPPKRIVVVAVFPLESKMRTFLRPHLEFVGRSSCLSAITTKNLDSFFYGRKMAVWALTETLSSRLVI